MKEALTFLLFKRFVEMDLSGGSNGGTRFRINVLSPFLGSDSKLDPAYDSEAFTSTTNDCFEWHSSVLFQGILWNSHHFPMSFFVFPLSVFVCGLDKLSRGFPSLLYPFFYWLGLPFPCLFYEGFANPKCRIFCLIFYSILTTYQ
jgi:hypothetical protein